LKVGQYLTIGQYLTKLSYTKQSVSDFWATLYVVLWKSRSFDVQINARRIKFVKDMHKCHNYHAILHKLYTWFGKNALRLYLNGAKISSIGGRPPSKYAHAYRKVCTRTNSFNIVPFNHWPRVKCGLRICGKYVNLNM